MLLKRFVQETVRPSIAVFRSPPGVTIQTVPFGSLRSGAGAMPKLMETVNVK